jgi:tetratricopeptide (TPR) repeat protein
MRDRRLGARAVGVVIAALSAGTAFAQAQGRVVSTVLDERGSPLPAVRITATTKRTAMAGGECLTGADGRCTIALIDATMTYDFVLMKQGFQRLEVSLKIVFGTTDTRTFQLASEGSGAESRVVVSAEDRLSMGETRLGVLKLVEAIEAERVGDLESALVGLRDAVRLQPDLAAAHARLASVALRLGLAEEAASAAKRAVDLDPASAAALLLRFEACRRLGDEDGAAETIAAMRARGSLADAVAVVFNEAVDALNRDDLRSAETSFVAALELDPDLDDASLALTDIAARQGRWREAAARADDVLRSRPGHIRALKIRYVARRELGEADAAREALLAVAAVDPEWAAPDLFNRGSNLYNAGRVAEAKVAVTELLGLVPDYAAAHYLLALCYDREGDRSAARKHLERYLELAPDGADAASARRLVAILEGSTPGS